MNEQVYCILDYETRSEADLKKLGAYEYANHHSTRILCVSWRVGTREQLKMQLRLKKQWDAAYFAQYPEGTMKNPHAAKIWSYAFDKLNEDAEELDEILMNKNIKVVAHNALFEQVITRFVLAKLFMNGVLTEIPHERWICTASMAAALALPRNLEGACNALDLDVKKDMDGRRLILKYCKPRKPSKNNPSKWFNSARDLRRIMEYCQNDVDAETLLFLTIPPLNPNERKVWLLDQKINFRGFQADREMVKKTLEMIEIETANLKKETKEITRGRPSSTTQRDAVLKWVREQGVFLPNLRAKTVGDAIREGLVEGDVERLLKIRQSISKTSTKKYVAFEARSRTDGRVRDILVYHTASTGRWGGAGVQPQNFPRGSIDNTTLAADICRTGDLEFIRCIYGNPMEVFASCLRSVITAPEGRRFLCADFAAIEARVLFWAAKHDAGLKAFFEETPMYEEMASVIYNVPLDEVTKLQRQVGKQSFLGCGYGMGSDKFLATCKNFGIEVDEETAVRAVQAYRQYHAPVVQLWNKYQRAAIAAVRRKGERFKINRTYWWVSKLKGTDLEFLWCELPSKRRLAYFGPKIKWETTKWGEKRPILYHWGVNPLTKKWELASTYGGRLVENVVQAISRDLMVESMLRIENAGYEVVLTVHDEILAEAPLEFRSLENFEALMKQKPPWADGLPVKAEGWEGPRYQK